MKNLKEQVAELLDKMKVHYKVNENKCRFELDIPTDNADVTINIFYDEQNDGLYNLSCLTFNLPKGRTTALLRKINEINNATLCPAHLYLDDDGNRLAAQSVIYVTGSGIDKDVFQSFLFVPANMLDENFSEIMKVAFGTETEDKLETKEK